MTHEERRDYLQSRNLVLVYGYFVAAELYEKYPTEIRTELLRKVTGR
jgi:hypothetical protein